MGVHRSARDSGSIRRGRRADARMVASGKTAAQRWHERATRKVRRCVHIHLFLCLCLSAAVIHPSRANIHHLPSNRILQVCYSHWVLSSMAILNKLTWIDSAALTRFILSAQVRRRTFGRMLVPFHLFLCFTIYLSGPRGRRNRGQAG